MKRIAKVVAIVVAVMFALSLGVCFATKDLVDRGSSGSIMPRGCPPTTCKAKAVLMERKAELEALLRRVPYGIGQALDKVPDELPAGKPEDPGVTTADGDEPEGGENGDGNKPDPKPNNAYEVLQGVLGKMEEKVAEGKKEDVPKGIQNALENMSEATPAGKADEPHGKADEPHGKADQPHGKADEPHGKADELHGKADEPHGKAAELHGKAELHKDDAEEPEDEPGDEPEDGEGEKPEPKPNNAYQVHQRVRQMMLEKKNGVPGGIDNALTHIPVEVPGDDEEE